MREFSGKMALAASRYGKEKEYWLNKLSGEWEKSRFPFDHSKASINIQGNETNSAYKLDVTGVHFNDKLVEKLLKIAKDSDYMLHMILVTGVAALLGKYTCHNDIILGMPVYKKEIEGELLNTALVLRNQLGDDMSFKELLLQVRQTVIDADKNQNYPVETLLYHLDMSFSGDDFPLFDVVVLLENIHQKKDIAHTRPNIIFSFVKNGNHIEGTVEYHALLYHKETIQRIIEYFTRLLEEAIFNIDLPVLSIDILAREEKEQLLNDFNRTQTDYPFAKTIDRLFEEQAVRNPDKIAVSDEHGCLAYKMVNERSRRLALYLQSKGLPAEEAVGIMVENSCGMIIGILGILKAGGGYLPLNSDYPQERRKYLLKDVGASKVLALTHGDSYEGVDVICMNDPGIYSTSTGGDPQELQKKHSSGSLAYIMYTSGSTGNPKGVMIEHGSVIRLVKNTNFVELREQDRILQTGALDFDASTFEIWGALLNGLQLYLVSKEVVLTPGMIKTALRKNQITTTWMTSPLFNQLVDEDIEIFRGLENLLVGGDVLSPVHINRVRRMFPALKIINGYGPTENTTFSVTHLIGREYQANIPIGKPIANSTAYILDQQNRPVPIGMFGELCVGGDGLSRGYLNNPELTNEKIKIDKSLSGGPGGGNIAFYKKAPLVYKTGDLARWLSDGNIEFLGRIDHQVKIRGYRIEPGEIENQITRLDNIAEAVLVNKESGREKYLCAYIVSEGNQPLDFVELKNLLSQRMPEYMVPSYFIQVDRIPLNPNGKVDRKLLPEPGLKAGENYAAPRDDIERRLVSIWSEVLGLEKEVIGIDTDFFQLGGHSLKATLLTARIHKEFNVKVPLAELFKFPTIRSLSKYITVQTQERHEPIPRVEEKEYYPLSSAQKRIFILHQLNEKGVGYNIPLFLILEGKVEVDTLESIFRHVINRHESMRTSFFLFSKEPVQKIHAPGEVEFKIEYYEDSKALLNFVRPFDLEYVPLIRVGLVKIEEEKHILMVDMHHIISDGTSLGIMVKEIMLRYGGKEPGPLGIQYRDYVEWRLSEKEKKSIIKQEEYWIAEFQGKLPVLKLPLDYKRPPIQSFEGSAINFGLGVEELSALNRLAGMESVTLYMTLLSVFYVLLSKLSGQEDIIVGTPVAGRRHTDLEKIIGMFVNTLALRNFPGGELTFREFLQEVKKKTLAAFQNQDYPFEDLVEKVPVKRDTGRNPLFDAMFGLQNMEIDRMEIPGLKLSPYEFDSRTSKFDLILVGFEIENKLLFSFEYCTALFNEETARKFIAYFLKVIAIVLENPGIRLSQIDILPDEEKNRIALDSVEEPVNNDEDSPGKEFVGPRTAIEKEIALIWGKLLGIEQIDVTQDFFQLGGNSIKALLLVSELNKEYDLTLLITDVFKLLTIERLGIFLEDLITKSVLKPQVIFPVEKKEYYDVSHSQKRLWVLSQFKEGATAYNMPAAFIITGVLRQEKFVEAFQVLAAMHESLRTVFITVGGEPKQKILGIAETGCHIDEKDFRGIGDRDKMAGELVEQEAKRVFDLERGPLVHARLLRLEDHKYLFLLNMHHIISDGWSMGVLIRDVTTIYADSINGKETLPLPLTIQYKDFTEWQNGILQGDNLAGYREYWLELFGDEVPVINLPTDYARPAVQGFEGDHIDFEIDSDLCGGLKTLALGAETTLYIVLLALYKVLLARLTDREDIVVGSPMAGRLHADLEKIIGMFVNTLAMRNYPSGEKTFAAFLEEVKERTLKAFDNQEYPYEYLVENVAVTRDVSRNPLFDTMFALQNAGSQEIDLPGLKLVPYQFDNNTSKFDLTLIAREVEEKLQLTFEYSTKLFKPETIERFIAYFKTIVRGVIENKERKISRLEILTAEEKHRILYDFNDTERDYPNDKTIHQLFEEQVNRAPDHISLVGAAPCGCPIHDGRLAPGRHYITYRELNNRSSRLGYYLRDNYGVGKEDLVGIYAENKWHIISGVLAILKAGGAFIGIDPGLAGDTLQYILDDSRCRVLLTDKAEMPADLDLGKVSVYKMEDAVQCTASEEGVAAWGNKEDSRNGVLCYLEYVTDGSGDWHGVMLEHGNVLNAVESLIGAYRYRGEWTYIYWGPGEFSRFMEGVWTPLRLGAAVHVLDRGVGLKDVMDYVRDKGINVVNGSVAQWLSYREEMGFPLPLDGVKSVCLEGAGVRPDLIEWLSYFLPGADIFKLYGEAECGRLMFHVRMPGEGVFEDGYSGRVFSNYRSYILDKYKNILPVGSVGELYIGGESISRGYINRPELTAEKFLEIGAGESRLERVYHVGRRGKYLSGGDVVLSGGQEYLAGSGSGSDGDGVPRTELERKIAGIWRKVLGIDDISVTADFFQLGGNSIKALLLVSELNEAFDVTLLIVDIFTHLTIEKFAVFLAGRLSNSSHSMAKKSSDDTGHIPLTMTYREEDGNINPSDLTNKRISIEIPGRLQERYDHKIEDIYPLTPMQEGMLFHSLMEKNSLLYSEQFSYRISGHLNTAIFEKSLNELIKCYGILRTVFLHEDFDRPVQVVLSDHPVDFFYRDIHLSSVEYREEFTANYKEKEIKRGFDLSRDMMLRAAIIRIKENEYDFTLTFHHIILDAWCLSILIPDFFQIYSALKENCDYTLSPIPPYKNYIQWLEMQDKKLSAHFWEKYLEDFKEMTFIKPIKPGKINDEGYKAEEIAIDLDLMKSTALNDLAQGNHVTLCVLLQGLWAILLSRYTGKDDVVFGLVVSGRPSELKGVQRMVGLFINTVPLRIRTRYTGQVIFKDFIKKIQEDALRCEPHHYYPLARIQAESPLKQNLLDHIFVFENAPDIATLENISARNHETSRDIGFKISSTQSILQNNYDFNIITLYQEKLNLLFSYNANIFEKEFVESIAGHFLRLIDQVLEDDQIDVAKMDILDEKEKNLLIKTMRNMNEKSFFKTLDKNEESTGDLEADFNF